VNSVDPTGLRNSRPANTCGIHPDFTVIVCPDEGGGFGSIFGESGLDSPRSPTSRGTIGQEASAEAEIGARIRAVRIGDREIYPGGITEGVVPSYTEEALIGIVLALRGLVARAGLRLLGSEFGAVGPGAITRSLLPKDIGIKGTVNSLVGTFTIDGAKAIVRVDLIIGRIQNPFSLMRNLANTARAEGATVLRVEGIFLNDRLATILERRFNVLTQGAVDYIEIQL